MTVLKYTLIWTMAILTFTISIPPGAIAAPDSADTPDKVSEHSPQGQTAAVEELPDDRSWWSKYKWWVIAGVVVVGGAAAAGGGGGGGGGGSSDSGGTETTSATVQW